MIERRGPGAQKPDGTGLYQPLGLFLFLLVLVAPGSADSPGQGLDPFPRALAAVAPRATPPSLEADSIPPRVDLSEFLPPVQSQGQIGSCAAWSTIYYARTLLEQKQRGWGAEASDHQLSPLYSYNQITQGRNEGTAITAHMALLKEQGIVSMVDFPYVDRLDVQPSQDLKEKASELRISDYKSLPRRDEAMDLDAVRSCLAQGFPVVGGFELFADFASYRGGVYRTVSGPTMGGHAMAIVGYDDEKGALRIVNSWGPAWGESGYLWLSYESVAAMTTVDYGCAVMFDLAETTPALGAPMNLSASQGESETAIFLSWSAQPNVDSYTIWRADNVTQEWNLLATTRITKFADSSLPPGVTYVYTIRAERGSGSSKIRSEASPLVQGSTQQKSNPPGIVRNLVFLPYQTGGVLVWDPLTANLVYRVFRYDRYLEQFVQIGTSADTVYRDLEGFGDRNEATYFVQAVNDHGAGLPCPSLTVVRSAPSEALSSETTRKIVDDRPLPVAQRTPYSGPYDDANWFDKKYVDRAFADFAAQEKAAFAAWKTKDQNDFEEFLKNDH